MQVRYADSQTGELRWQSLEVLMQEQGVFASQDAQGAYRRFGASQQMNVYIDPLLQSRGEKGVGTMTQATRP